jgi:hypothetical protein
MSGFKIEKHMQGQTLKLKILGQIDEDAVFEGVGFDGAGEIEIDLEKVAAINSCGIREWVKWIRSAPSNSKFVFHQCPKIIVDQMNMVNGFLPQNAVVDSFFVPYYCDSTGSEKMVLFKNGAEFNGPSLKPPEIVKDDETGEAMEMDVIEAKYFKFLQR